MAHSRGSCETVLLFVQVAALEREQVEIKDEENERLRSQLQEINKKLLQQAEDHEVIICTTYKYNNYSVEFIILVNTLSQTFSKI